MSNVYILLGSNLGNQLSNLQEACSFLQAKSIKVIASSLIYRTKAWGNVNQDDFLNVVLNVKTQVGANQLLKRIISYRNTHGTSAWRIAMDASFN